MPRAVCLTWWWAVFGLAAGLAYAPGAAPLAGGRKPLARQSPGQSVSLAARALAGMPKETWPYVRFLSAYHVTDEEDLKSLWKATTFALNSLSRRRSIKSPLLVPGTDGRLAWFDYRWYDIPPEALDNLAAKGSGAVPVPQPFFHATIVKLQAAEETVVVEEPYQYVQNGILYQGTRQVTRTQKAANGGKKAVQEFGPWLPAEDVALLAKGTETLYPVFRADWFVAYSLIEPRYHELLGLDDTEASFRKLALLDEKNKEKIELRGSSDTRLVALNNRILIRWTTVSGLPAGYFWESNDFETSIDGEDVLADLFPKANAKEVIFTLPNGLQAYGVFANGVRADKAAASVAIDSETRHQDKQVWSARNCITCHSQGMRDFANLIKKLPQGRIALQVADPKKAVKVEDIYFSVDIEAVIKSDQALYTARVLGLNGLSPAANATLYDKVEYGYTEPPVTILQVAADTGVEPAVALEVMGKAVNIDPSLVRLLQDPPLPVRREQFDRRGYGQLQLLLSGAGKLPPVAHGDAIERPPPPPPAVPKSP